MVDGPEVNFANTPGEHRVRFVATRESNEDIFMAVQDEPIEDPMPQEAPSMSIDPTVQDHVEAEKRIPSELASPADVHFHLKAESEQELVQVEMKSKVCLKNLY